MQGVPQEARTAEERHGTITGALEERPQDTSQPCSRVCPHPPGGAWADDRSAGSCAATQVPSLFHELKSRGK